MSDCPEDQLEALEIELMETRRALRQKWDAPSEGRVVHSPEWSASLGWLTRRVRELERQLTALRAEDAAALDALEESA